MPFNPSVNPIIHPIYNNDTKNSRLPVIMKASGSAPRILFPALTDDCRHVCVASALEMIFHLSKRTQKYQEKAIKILF